MKELEFIEIIKNTLSKSSCIGDDCAYLKDLGIVITHDSLVEGVHFSREFSSHYDLGYKSVMVNLSDIYAAGAKPKYITISLSLPGSTEDDFVKEFYEAVEDIAKRYDFEVIGGDITGSDKIFISVCAIGTTEGRTISSRKNAHVGDYVITSGVHGSSVAGLWILEHSAFHEQLLAHPEFLASNIQASNLVDKYLRPTAQRALSEDISTKITTEYAMMDTSDGLMDALYKIASSSNVLIEVDFNKVPYDKQIESVAKFANAEYPEWVLYGGEDFEIVACISEQDLEKLDKKNYTIIGRVKEKTEDHFVEVDLGYEVQKVCDLEKSFNHFKEKQ